MNLSYYPATDTLLFKQVIGTYEDFSSSYVANDTVKNMTVYKDNTGVKAKLDEWLPEVYRILLRHYRNWNIIFDNSDDFLDLLWERIEGFAPNYFVKKFYYDRLLSLDDESLLDEGISIQNFTQHTNDTVEDIWTPLKQITNQNSNKGIGAISTKIKGQIYAAKMNLVREFVEKFKDLFILISASSNFFG